MRIDIKDDNENWLNWGTLVRDWVKGKPRPTTVKDLKAQLAEASVIAAVDGPDDRVVTILDYAEGPGNPLVIMIPTAAMLQGKLATVTSGRYPLPLFYDIAFGGAARANLSAQESLNFALRRIGEYTVNECC
jgi:hypothetical protein